MTSRQPEILWSSASFLHTKYSFDTYVYEQETKLDFFYKIIPASLYLGSTDL